MTNRREFLKTAAVAGAAVSTLSFARPVHAAGSGKIRVGLVGCGGRGTGAAGNALEADEDVVLTAFGDLFDGKAAGTMESLKSRYNDRVLATKDQCFSGFDNYKQVIENCDVVLLATTPHYRPIHLAAAIDAGKHAFIEKPNAVDAFGIKSCLESAAKAKQKGLTLISGLCWRYHKGVVETMNRILDGMIGDIREIQETYLTGRLWTRPRNEGDTEMMFQNRNWYNFSWLSGDYNLEQHVHSLDKSFWALGAPQAAWGCGARMNRVEQPAYGDIYDMMGVTYEYANGVKVHSFCRQISGCYNETQDQFLGTKGYASALDHVIKGLDGKEIWRMDRKDLRGVNMYVDEHKVLYKSIKNGEAKNDGEYSSMSTMMGIIGREACYTGAKIGWDQMLNSQKNMSPATYDWDAVPPTKPLEGGKYEVPMPGVTQFK